MSGGSFRYAFTHVSQFAEELRVKLDEYKNVNEYGDTPNYFASDVRSKLREIQHQAERLSALMREAEWLYSGDTGENSFIERVAEIESKHGKGDGDV